MLKIRLSRTGRKNYPAYRIVLAEHSSAVKGKFIEILGHYLPIQTPKVLKYDEKKIKEWISKGAKPSDTVASLLKNDGVSGMEKYIEPKNKKKKKKKEVEEKPETAAAPVEKKVEEKPTEAPVEKVEEKPKEVPAEEKVEEKTEEKPEKKAEKVEEAKKEEISNEILEKKSE